MTRKEPILVSSQISTVYGRPSIIFNCEILISFLFCFPSFSSTFYIFFEEVSPTNDNDIAILTKNMRKLKTDFSVLDLITFHSLSIFQLRLGIKARINSFVCRQQHTMADDKNNRFTRQKKKIQFTHR